MSDYGDPPGDGFLDLSWMRNSPPEEFRCPECNELFTEAQNGTHVFHHTCHVDSEPDDT